MEVLFQNTAAVYPTTAPAEPGTLPGLAPVVGSSASPPSLVGVLNPPGSYSPRRSPPALCPSAAQPQTGS